MIGVTMDNDNSEARCIIMRECYGLELPEEELILPMYYTMTAEEHMDFMKKKNKRKR